MKIETAKKIIEKELLDLNVARDSVAWKTVYDNALEASDIFTKKELILFIEGSLEVLSLCSFYC